MNLSDAKPMPCFITELRQAIREDKKTQTRRIIKPVLGPEAHWQSWENVGWKAQGLTAHIPIEARAKIIYQTYEVGDICYLREPIKCGGCPIAEYVDDGEPVLINDQTVEWDWQRSSLPQIHMPKIYARTFCQITEVRVQHVQEISEADALAEGITWPDRDGHPFRPPIDTTGISSLRIAAERFSQLWDSINAKRGYPWSANNFVWVYTFKRIKP